MQGSTPQECFQAARAQAISEINADLDAWEARLFPPEEEEEPETKEETTTEEENDEEA